MSVPTTFLLGGDLPVRRLGYGAMRLTQQPGNFGPYPDWEGGKALLRRAVELGVNFIDTAHSYGPGWNERLIGEALAPYPPGVVIATKGGTEKTSPTQIFPDGRPETLRRRCDESRALLRVERIDLYQLHRPDPQVPWAETIGALAELRAQGKVRHLGLSNVTLEQVESARALVPIASVQNRFNFNERGDDPLLEYCGRHGIAFIPWGPLAGQPLEPGAPLVADEGPVAALAKERGLRPVQAAILWLLERAPHVLVIPGTRSVAHLEENLRLPGWS